MMDDSEKIFYDKISLKVLESMKKNANKLPGESSRFKILLLKCKIAKPVEKKSNEISIIEYRLVPDIIYKSSNIFLSIAYWMYDEKLDKWNFMVAADQLFKLSMYEQGEFLHVIKTVYDVLSTSARTSTSCTSTD